MYKIFFAITVIFFAGALVVFFSSAQAKSSVPQWQIRSIDTMKYSRDLARVKLDDSLFDAIINQQMAAIAATGANYVAIDTPYDEEFLPILRRWVLAARSHNLHIWFRGNLSGWEQWFGYPKIDPLTHTKMIQSFITAHSDLFADGDIFTSCPECENGWHLNTSDPYDVSIYRKFLISEYLTTKVAFQSIRRNVIANFYSMNKNVADAVMDAATINALDGVIVIDHYVASPIQLGRDVSDMAKRTHASIVLGEFGAPIPDLNGDMSDAQQAQWVDQVLAELSKTPQLIGLNYWVNTGGSTGLWTEGGTQKPAVGRLSAYYTRRITPLPSQGPPLPKGNSTHSFFSVLFTLIIKIINNLQFHFSY